MDTQHSTVWEKGKGTSSKSNMAQGGRRSAADMMWLSVSEVESRNVAYYEGLEYLTGWQLVCYFEQNP